MPAVSSALQTEIDPRLLVLFELRLDPLPFGHYLPPLLLQPKQQVPRIEAGPPVLLANRAKDNFQGVSADQTLSAQPSDRLKTVHIDIDEITVPDPANIHTIFDTIVSYLIEVRPALGEFPLAGPIRGYGPSRGPDCK
jgi:hypothetical protein